MHFSSHTSQPIHRLQLTEILHSAILKFGVFSKATVYLNFSSHKMDGFSILAHNLTECLFFRSGSKKCGRSCCTRLHCSDPRCKSSNRISLHGTIRSGNLFLAITIVSLKLPNSAINCILFAFDFLWRTSSDKVSQKYSVPASSFKLSLSSSKLLPSKSLNSTSE